MIDEVSLLGQRLGNTINNQSTISQNLTADEDETQLQVPINLKIKETGQIVASKLTYASDAFILDHPVQGLLDYYSTIKPMVSFYDLNNNTTDLIAGKNATLNGSYTTGKFTNCALLSSTTSSLTLLAASEYTSGDLSVSFWAYLPAWDGGLTGNRVFTLGNTYMIYNGGTLQFMIGATGTWLLTPSVGWYFFEIVLGSTKQVKINTNTYTLSGTPTYLGSNIIFGGTNTKANLKIDEVYINNAQLASSVYNELYNSGNGYYSYYEAYKLDSGYQGTAPKFPLIFPVKFLTPDKTVLYTYNY